MTAMPEPLKQQLLSLHRDQRNVAAPGLVLTHAAWLTAVAWAGLAPGWISIPIAVLVIGVMQYRLVMSCHEAVHRTLLFPVRLNETVGLLHCAMVGINYIRYRRQHNGHHRADHLREDPDAYIYNPVLRTKPGWRRAAVWLAGTLFEYVEKFRQKGLAVRETASVRRTARWHSVSIVIAHLGLLTGLGLAIGWWAYPVLWLLPLFTVAIFLNRTRVIIEHGWPYACCQLDSGRVGDLHQMTIDVLTNPLERFILAPFSFNYHHAHHKIQTIPHYNNEQLSMLLDHQTQPQHSRRIRASYLSLLANILRGKPCHKLQFQL